MKIDIVSNFLSVLKERGKLYYPSVQHNYESNKDLFEELAITMLQWVSNYLGNDYNEILVDGYKYFVTDVNKSQIIYEKVGHYRNCNYEEVFQSTYDNKEHMLKYHWGVYVTTFGWEHHLKLYNFFKENYIPLLKSPGGHLLELGSGSGVWGMLALKQLKDWNYTGIDISQTSINMSNKMATVNGFIKNKYFVDDALTFRSDKKFNFLISCFLLEHLEQPQKLLTNMAKNLITGGYAFITVALTAAEIDHIHEFKNESEIVIMAESAGFRVISYYSSAPKNYPSEYKYLPRSIAVLMQKRKNSIW